MSQLSINQCVVFDIGGSIQNTVYNCDSTLLFMSDNYVIVHKKIILSETEDPINMFITYSDFFVRGYIYKDNQEYEILNYLLYNSLQIESSSYNCIGICSIAKNIFES